MQMYSIYTVSVRHVELISPNMNVVLKNPATIFFYETTNTIYEMIITQIVQFLDAIIQVSLSQRILFHDYIFFFSNQRGINNNK